MKQIKLLDLTLTNFKGIKSFGLHADGENISLYGDNATGKTSIFDAFVWLLFDKDSQNQKEFGIKTLINGEPIHNINHEVEATFLVDDEKLLLKKIFAEKWTKKRGSVTKEFTGHTTDYFIDGVPSNKKEYTAKTAELVDEEVFKLLTSPGYFNDQLHWKDRRKTLLEIAGDVSDEDVINSNDSLQRLTKMLGNHSVDDLKKIIAAKRKEINQELEKIPVRIDEIKRNQPDTDGLKESDINAQQEKLNAQIEAKTDKLNEIKNGSEINNLKVKISDIDLKLSQVKNEHANQGQQELYKLQTKLQEERSNASIVESKIKNNEQRKQSNEDNIKEFQGLMETRRHEWDDIKKQDFTHEESCNCPACGQELPQERLEEARDKAEKQFNVNKSEKLENIKSKGITFKQKVTALEQENESITVEINKLTEQLEAKKIACEKLETKIKEAKTNVKPITETEAYNTLIEEKQSIEQKIESLKASVNEEYSIVLEEREKLEYKKWELESDLLKVKQAKQSVDRIVELEEQQRELAAEFEKQEEALYLTEEFIRTKVNLLEDKINSKFKYARFNLFKQNINGGLEEICTTTLDGVPYDAGLNNAARINVGLDIIATLSEHYGVQACIFIDNAESITKIIDIEAQVISLVVSERDKVLRVEKAKEMELV